MGNPHPRYRFTFLSLYWAHKWLGFRANFTINSAEKMFATSSLRKHSRYRMRSVKAVPRVQPWVIQLHLPGSRDRG